MYNCTCFTAFSYCINSVFSLESSIIPTAQTTKQFDLAMSNLLHIVSATCCMSSVATQVMHCFNNVMTRQLLHRHGHNIILKQYMACAQLEELPFCIIKQA